MALLQIITIIASRGDVFLLGEAYAFGVVWSFALKALGVLVLRYQRHDQEYKFPFNITLGGSGNPDRPGGSPPRSCSWSPSPTCSRKRSPPFTAFRSPSSCTFCSWFPNASTPARSRNSARDLEKFNLDHQPEIDCRTLCTPGPAACWWPCAITAACGICRRFSRKPTCAATTSS